jgi:hypothetical protein
MRARSGDAMRIDTQTSSQRHEPLDDGLEPFPHMGSFSGKWPHNPN